MNKNPKTTIRRNSNETLFEESEIDGDREPVRCRGNARLMTTGSALAAGKTSKNSTNVDVEVQVGAAAGSPENEGMRGDRG